MESGKLKNYLIGILLCLVVALSIGIKPVQRVVNEALKRGTVGGAEICLSYVGGELLSEDAAKAKCTSTFQKRLHGTDYASGRAGPRFFQDTVRWNGSLTNKSSDYVTTWVLIVVSIYDAEGVEQEVSAETSIWLEPMADAEFEVLLEDVKKEQFENIDFCDRDAAKPKSCMDWGIAAVKGLSI